MEENWKRLKNRKWTREKKAKKSQEVDVSQTSKVANEEKMYKTRVPYPSRRKQQ